MILVGEAADENTIRTLKNAEYPFVLLEKQCKTGRHNTICSDLSSGSQLVADHISKLGYSNIVILTDSKLYKADREHLNVLVDALGRQPGVNRPVIFESGKAMLESEPDFSRIDQFLRPPYRADAIIVMNAGLVFPLMNILRKKNLRIPVDIAVISMEEGEGFDLVYSPLTCLRKPLAAISAKTGNMIWGEIRNAGKSKFKRQINLQPELVIRSSSGKI
jgi:DNA-binding LacI/PurR family transcriptional regulator